MAWKKIEVEHTDKELCEYGWEYLEDLMLHSKWKDGKATVTLERRDLNVALHALQKLDERIKAVPYWSFKAVFD